MGNSRYKYTEQKKDEDGNRVFKTTLYPNLDADNTEDVFIETETARRLDRVANEYYDDATLWWVIAEANNLGRGTIFVDAGIRLRIPMNISRVFTKLRNKNENR